MIKIDHKIIIVGIASLTAIETIQIIYDHDTTAITSLIVGIIALSIGIIIPSPKIDNKLGVLRW